MKLEFKKGSIPGNIFEELEFKGFLDLFETDLDLIPHLTLQPLDKNTAYQHLNRLHGLEEQISRHRINLDSLVKQSKQLPAIDYLLPFFRESRLEVFHLFDLGRFVQEVLALEIQEERIPLESKASVCKTILQKMLAQLTEDFGSLKLNPVERKLQQKIAKINQTLETEFANLEERVFQETKIKMVYPFPKEIDKTSYSTKKLESSMLLETKELEDVYQLSIKPQGHIVAIQEEKEELSKELKAGLSKTLKLLNDTLSGYYDLFSEYYSQRKRRVFDYILLRTAQKNNWCLPKLTSSSTINLKNGILPELQQKVTKRYKPLDVSLKNGVNVLFGANMTGKSTVLKTLFFHLTLVKFGLPVPAESLELGFPEEAKILLRSSGKLQSGLSGFGDELRFFCELADNMSVYLVDELFHSTDPVNGVKLTKAFLNGLSNSNSIILCTSHYPEILELSNVTFLKMKDIEEEPDENDIQSLLENIPYELEPIAKEELQDRIKHSDYPLKVALRFPLPEKILNNIRKKLEK